MARRRSKISLMDLINARFIEPGQILLFTPRYDAKASVTPNGTLIFQGAEYNTLSEAARAITGHEVNGWNRWCVRSLDGRLTRMAYIRKYLEE